MNKENLHKSVKRVAYKDIVSRDIRVGDSVEVRSASRWRKWRQKRCMKKLVKAEHAYLKSFGWKPVNRGLFESLVVFRGSGIYWHPPMWHPKYMVQSKPYNTPYDQAHAVNSQKKYLGDEYRTYLSKRKLPYLTYVDAQTWSIMVLFFGLMVTSLGSFPKTVNIFGPFICVVIWAVYDMYRHRKQKLLDDTERVLASGSPDV